MKARTYRRITRGVVGLAATLTLASCKGDAAAEDTSTTENAVLVGPENIIVVAAQQLRTGPTLSGTIEAERAATVRAEIPAAVIETYAEPGQRVPAGAVIARLEATSIRDNALSGQAAVATAENAYDIAKRELERAEALEKAGAIAIRDLERARNGELAARTQLANARAMNSNAQSTLGKTQLRAPFAGVISARQVNAGDVVSPGTAAFTVV